MTKSPPKPPTPIPATVSVHFSPNGGCTAALVAEIDAARKSVLVLAYGFTSIPVSDALVRAKARGVDVRIVLDARSNEGSPASRGDECLAAGIPVLYDKVHPIAHNKITIIDGKVTVGGSWNMSHQADSNAENMTIATSVPLAAVFADNWKLHAGHSHPATPTPIKLPEEVFAQ